MVSSTCAGCSTVFERTLAEVKRQRRGRPNYPFFCSRRCYSVSQGSRNLEELWRSQEGRCALSGLRMEMPGTGQAWEKQFRDPFKPSLDRIDNELGYVKGNVRLVCVIANMAKGAFSDEDLVTFCTAVAALHAPPVAFERPPPVYRFASGRLAA